MSATTTVSVDKRHNRPLLFQDRRYKMTEEDRKDKPSEGVVTQQGEVRKRADITESVQILGIPPVCQHHKTESGCKFGDQCVFSQPNKKPKKCGGKGSVALLKNSKQLACVFQDVESPKSKSISRKGTKFLGSKRSVHISKDTLHPVKLRERKGPSQSVIEHVELQERSSYAPELEDRSEDEMNML